MWVIILLMWVIILIMRDEHFGPTWANLFFFNSDTDIFTGLLPGEQIKVLQIIPDAVDMKTLARLGRVISTDHVRHAYFGIIESM